MNKERFQQLTSHYPEKRIAVIGDFCLDRYFEIDPALEEVSIETGLPVRNIVNTRCQPGGAGTVLNNLCALGASCFPVGVSGCDGEGWELKRGFSRLNCRMDAWVEDDSIQTPTYNKPLMMYPGRTPEELNRLDVKNRHSILKITQELLIERLQSVIKQIDFCVFMEQVDLPETGVLGAYVLERAVELCRQYHIPCIGDSRLGLGHFPRMIFKMNRDELEKFSGQTVESFENVRAMTEKLARKNQYPVFVTLAEKGICAALPEGGFFHEPACLRPGPIDIVGAGDAVTANLTMAVSCGASVSEAMQLAMKAASIVVHKLGTTGTASVEELALE